VGPGLSSTASGDLAALLSVPPYSKPAHELLDGLPSRDLADLLVKSYSDFQSTLTPVIPELEGALFDQFEALYEPEPKIDSYANVSILYLMFAIGLQFMTSEERSQIGKDTDELRRQYYGKGREAVGKSETAEPASLERILAILMLGVYLKTEGRPSDDYHLIGQAIRLAQSMVCIVLIRGSRKRNAEYTIGHAS
jgi:hypothetical protein